MKVKLKKAISFFRLNLEGVVWIIALCLLAFMDPANTQQSLCLLHNLGVESCPGCGLGHSVSSAFHGDFDGSFRQHPLGLAAIVLLSFRSFQVFYQNIKYQLLKTPLMTKIYEIMPDIQGEEMLFLQNLTQEYSEEKLRNFANIYRARRKDPQLVLLLTLLGFLGFAGIHRIILNQIGMGILYFFTAGLCLIGTIVDLVNYQSMSFGFNRVVATEIHAMMASNK